MSQSDAPNLIKIRRLDSNEIGDANLALTTITPTNKSIGGSGDDGGIIGNKLSKKPPLDKEKRQQQTLISNKSPSTTTTNSSQRPSMQGWLYKLKEPSLNASISSSSSLNTLNSDFNVHKSSKSKWKNYW